MKSRKALEEDFASSYYYEDQQRKILLEAILDVRDLLTQQKGSSLEITDANGKVIKRYSLTPEQLKSWTEQDSMVKTE